MPPTSPPISTPTPARSATAPRTPIGIAELDTPARLRAAIGKLSRRLRPTAAGSAAGLTPTRASILLHVVREGRVRVSELAAAEGINPTMLSRVAADLAEAGLVQRQSDAADRRAAWLKSTAAGRRLAERIRRERSGALAAALQELTSDQRAALEAALPALEALADHLAGGRW
jgi:DNA-binding MarR family transcriptional regulator